MSQEGKTIEKLSAVLREVEKTIQLGEQNKAKNTLEEVYRVLENNNYTKNVVVEKELQKENPDYIKILKLIECELNSLIIHVKSGVKL